MPLDRISAICPTLKGGEAAKRLNFPDTMVDILKKNPDMDATSAERPDRPGPDVIDQDSRRPLPLADDRYEALVRQMPDALYIVADDIIVFVNEAGVRLFGAQTARDIVGHELDEFVHDNSMHLARQRREWMVSHGDRKSVV